VLRRRVDVLGVAEPTLQRSGDARVIVELPGLTDPEEALEVIGQTAQLTFHPVLGVGPATEDDAPDADENDDADAEGPPAADDDEVLELPDEDGQILQLGPVALTGEAVDSAQPVLGGGGGSLYSVGVDFRGGGAWQELTAEAACNPPGDPRRRVAIVLDDEVISSPQVSPEVVCGQGLGQGGTSITGQFDEEGANELALLIRAGALPVPIEVVEQRTIGPTLGQDAIESSVLAALIGVAATALYLVAAYRLFGLIAGLALVVYGLLSYAVLGSLGAVLTLPGIAGFVLAIGMAVDANVLVFERAKEERHLGKTVRTSTRTGFQKALSAVVDSNVTTIIAALLLFFTASGAVRGFGITLAIGVIVSMFTALVAVRVIIEWIVASKRLGANADRLGLNAWRGVADWLEAHQPDLMGRARIWLSVGLAGIVLAAGGLAIVGPQFGLEFTGGQLLEYRTEQTVDVDQLRGQLDDAGLPGAVVQASADDQIAIRTADLTEDQQATAVATVEELGGGTEIIREEFIGPTIGDELRQGALIALGLALIGQLIYLAVRFRWTYGGAAVVTMFHDMALVIGAFVWLGRELDGVFLAAVLTIIGYSINDTVVIFDRVRERRELEPDRPLAAVTNEACLQTLPRTVNTGVGAWFILLALLFLGGDTLTDFALALLIGTLVGSVSSLLIASPLFLWFEKLRDRYAKPPPPEETKKRGVRVSRSDGARV
jgi:SecD/SecF fusion protein